MERRFLKILDRSLLGACALLLAGALIIAAIGGVNFIAAMYPGLDQSYISVPYTPFQAVTSPGSAPAASEDAADHLSAVDLKLMDLATPGCQAIGRFASAISNGKLFIHGAGLTVCERAQLSAAKKFGNRAVNYLNEFSSYFTQLSTDPHATTQYLYVSDDQKREAVADVVKGFTSKFRAKIDAQNSKNREAIANASNQHVTSLGYFVAAGACLLAFFTTAFLAVFLRVETHLGRFAGKDLPPP